MNARRVALFLAVILAVLTFTIPAVSEPGDSIVVNGADEIVEPSVAASQDLLDKLEVVDSRVVAQYANSVRHETLPAVPAALQTLLGQVAERVVVEYANTVRREDLAAVPGPLQTLLDGVSERVVFQYANANREFKLDYPLELVNDVDPPQISNMGANIMGGSTVSITWTTNEFATSTVLYGTESGTYPNTETDPLYVKEHAVGLTGLTPATTYYYKARSTDLSGNTTTSPEHSFIAMISVYLPLVMRSH